MMDDKKKSPPQISDVGEMLASECFEALKKGDKARFSMCIKEMISIEVMKREGGEDAES